MVLDVAAQAVVVADGVSAYLGDCANKSTVQVLGVLLLAPALLGFLGVLAFEVRRWWRFRHGQCIDLQSVVRGTGAGFYASHMPGRLHLTPDGVWWVAEGADTPVAVRGLPVSMVLDGDFTELLPSVTGDSGVPIAPQPVPKPLWQGTIDGPATLMVWLDDGGYAEVTVRGESLAHVLEALSEPDVDPAPPAPGIVGRPPMVRFTLMIMGLTLALAGLGADALFRADSCGIDDGGGLAFLALGGVWLFIWGAWIVHQRERAVRANRATLNLSAPSDAGDLDDGGTGSESDAHGSQAADTVWGETAPDVPPLTYRTIRDILARRRADEGWGAVKPRDPRDERRARRAVGARSLTRARAAVQSPTRTHARYLLARDLAGDDQLILFPPYGDVAPIGVVDMMRPCLGAIPFEATVTLAGTTDPATRQPKVNAWIVPLLDSIPLWPGWPLESLDQEDLSVLVTGIDDETDGPGEVAVGRSRDWLAQDPDAAGAGTPTEGGLR